MRQPFEKLEDRHLLATVEWDGGGDGQTWHDPLNWVGDSVPAATDDAVIQDAASELVVQIDFNVEVASIDTTESLEVVNAELRTDALTAHELTLENGILNPITPGSLSATITGDLTLREEQGAEVPASQFIVLGLISVGGDLHTYPGLNIEAFGPGTELQVDGEADLRGVRLFAFDGGVLAFPGVTEFAHESQFSGDSIVYQAEGPGARIELDSLTTLAGGHHRSSDFVVTARDGGVVSMSSLTTMMDPARTDTRSRSFRFTATGTGSQIDLSSLVSVHDRDRGEASFLSESSGGDIVLGSLESAFGFDLTLGNDATVGPNTDLAALQHLENSYVRLRNDAFDVPLLERMTLSTFDADLGATLSAPVLNDFFASTLIAAGGSQISLPAVDFYSSWTTGSSQVRRFRATGAGSSISLPNLEAVEGGDHYNSQLYFEAFDGGSLDLSGLRSLDDPDYGDKRLRRFGLNADGAGSVIDVSALETIRDYRSSTSTNEHSSVTATDGGNIIAPQLSQVRGVNLLLNNESTITPDQLTAIEQSIITVRDADQSFVGLRFADQTQFDIQEAFVDLSTLETLKEGKITVRSGGSVDVSSLYQIDGSDFDVSGGATLAIPAALSARDTVTSSSHSRSWNVSGAGSVLSLPNVKTITAASAYNTRHFFNVSDGATLSLPGLESIQDDSGDNRLGGYFFNATGTETVVDISGLKQIVDYNSDLLSRLEAKTGATILSDALVNVRGVDIIDDGTGSITLAQLESLNNSELTLSGDDLALNQLSYAVGGRLDLNGVNLTLPLVESLAFGSIIATAGASLTAPLLTNIDGANINLSGGVTVSLPGVTHYRHGGTSSQQDRSWLADGIGTRLELPNLESIFGGTGYDNDMTIRATGGAVVDLSSLNQLRDLPDGDRRLRSFQVTASGAGSSIDLSSLERIIDSSYSNHQYSVLDASQDGQLIAPVLVDLMGVESTIDTDGDIEVALLERLEQTLLRIDGEPSHFAALDSIVSSRLELTATDALLDGIDRFTLSTLVTQAGSTVSMPAVSNIDGASFQVNAGTQVSLPNVVQYDLQRTVSNESSFWNVDGADSVLDLSNLRWIRGGTGYQNALYSTVTAGGLLDLSSVEQITDRLDGDNRRRRFEFTANGAGSTIRFDSLVNLLDRNADVVSRLTEVNDGEIVAPQLTSLVNVATTLNSPVDSQSSSSEGSTSDSQASGEDSQGSGEEEAASSSSQTGQVVTWIGGSGDWSTAANWSTGSVPGINDDVFLDDQDVTVTISSGARLVRSINAVGGLQVNSGASLTINGPSHLSGNVMVQPSGALAAAGKDASLLVDGLAQIDGANLTVVAGAEMRFSTLPTYSHGSTGNHQHRTWLVEDPGSRLTFDALTTINNGTHYNSRVLIQAYGGAEIELPSLTSILDPDTGDVRLRRVNLIAGGRGARINAPLLTTIYDRSSLGDGYYSSLEARDGGGILTPTLETLSGTLLIREGQSTLTLGTVTTIDRVQLDVFGTSLDLSSVTTAQSSVLNATNVDVDLGALTTWERGRFTLYHRSTLSAPLLANINATNLQAFGNTQIELPAVTTYDHASTTSSQTRSFLADGFGSVLRLPNLTSIGGGAHYNADMTIAATSGGLVDLPLVTQILDGGGDTRERTLNIIADGYDSQIRLDSLTEFTDANSDRRSLFTARLHGAIHAPLLTTLGGIEVYLDGRSAMQTSQITSLSGTLINLYGGDYDFSGLTTAERASLTLDHATIDIGTLAEFKGGRITVRGGGSVDLSQLTNIDGGSVTAIDGSSVDLSGVTEYLFAATGNNVYRSWVAHGAGSSINLSGLMMITGGTFYGSRIDASAVAGGSIDLSGLTEVIDGESGDNRQRYIRFNAVDVDSVIDLRTLESFGGGNTDVYSRLVAEKGGALLLDSLTALDGIEVTTDSRSSPLSFPSLTVFDRGRVNSVGAEVTFSALETSTATSFIATRDGVIDLPQLTTLTRGLINLETGSASTGALASIDGTGLVVSGGSRIELPSVTSYDHATTGSNQRRQIIAAGYGSEIALPNLATMNGGNAYNAKIQIDARDGAKVDLSGLVSITEPDSGDRRFREINFTANGRGSEIDLRSLTSFADISEQPISASANRYYSKLTVLGGGKIDAAALTEIEGVRIYSDADSQFPSLALQQATNSVIQMVGRSGAADTADSSRFADAVLRYDPDYSNGNTPTSATDPTAALGAPDFPENGSGFVSLGQGGLLELAFTNNRLTNSGSDKTDLKIFEIGPQVEDTFVAIRPTPETLPLLDPAMDSNSDGFFEIGAVTGALSEVDIDQFFPGFAAGQLVFDAVQLIDDPNKDGTTGSTVGADIDAVEALTTSIALPDLVSAPGTAIRVDGHQASLPALTTIARGEISTLDGATVSAPQLVNADSASLISGGGTTLSFPLVDELTHETTGSNQTMRLMATGYGSVLDLSNVTQITNGTHYGARIPIEAFEGGVVDLSGVEFIDEPSAGDLRYRRFDVLTEGVGSSVDFSSLLQATDRSSGSLSSSNRYSTFTSRYGGDIQVSSSGSDFPAGFSGVYTNIATNGTMTGFVSVARNSVFTGGGTFAGNLSVDGVITPAGRLTVDGDLTIRPDGRLDFEIGGLVPVVDHDVLDVTGEVSFESTNYAGQNGLLGEYFDNNNFTAPFGHRIDATIDFNYGSGAPISGMGTNDFSIRWTGQIEPLYSETYTFRALTDDGFRLWVDDQLIIDEWYAQPATYHDGTIDLEAGQRYDIRVEYYEASSVAVAQLSWLSASQALEVIPESQLFAADLNATIRTIRTNNHDPQLGDSYVVMNHGTRTGTPRYSGLDFGSQLLVPELGPTTLEFITGFSSGAAVTEITASDSAVDADGPFLRVTFSEPIDAPQFTPSDVSLLDPNGVAVPVVSVTPTSGTNLTFEIRPDLTTYTDGQYTITIGPDVLDFVGNPMNQDGDTVNGESTEDQFTGTFDWQLPDLDLVGGNVTTTETSYNFGDDVTLSLEVTNNSSVTAGGSNWTDRIYLSLDESLDGDDITLSSALRDAALGAGESYTLDLTFSLPLLDTLTSGTYYLLASIDDANQISESDEANVYASAALNLTLPPLVDLTPTSISGPTAGQPRQSHVFIWEVVNQGDEATNRSWSDRLYLESVATGQRWTVGTVTHSQTLQPGESYTSMMTRQLPDVIDGEYRLVIVTDYNNRIFEGPYEDNNGLTGGVLTMTHPDIEVRNLDAPATANSGQTITVSWDFLNSGSATAETWQQSLYLSDNQTLSSDDRLIDQYTVTTPLDPTQTRGDSRDVQMPVDLEGNLFLLVVSDTANDLGELSAGEANNVAAKLIELTLSPFADLAVSNVNSEQLIIGDPAEITVDWTVTNEGIGRGFTDEWTDAVVLSTDDIAGNSDDRVVATFEHTGGLDVGQSYTRSETFRLPPETTGRFHLFVRSDFGDNVFENDLEANNDVTRNGQVDIMPAPYADLIVESIDVPLPVTAGQSADVSWTVRNQGIGITNRGDWRDFVYLATDAAGQNLIANLEFSFQHFGQIAPDGTYTRTGTIQIPDGLEGDHYVVVHAARRDAPFEFIFNDNNVTVSDAFPITLEPAPDLIVTSLTAPTEAEEGNLIDVQWTVTNQGLGEADGVWEDRVYLQEAGNPNGEIIELGRFTFVDPIPPGQFYNRSESIRIPTESTGVFNLFVRTNYRERLYEGDATDNNTSSRPITVNVKPRADLQVESITIPDRLQAGQTLSPEFVVVNQGAVGTGSTRWVDRVYLSLDTVIDRADILIGEIDNAASLEPGERYTSEAGSVVVPIRYRGDVYVIAYADAADRISEWPNNNNNITYQSIFIEPEPLADLVVSDVVAPTQVIAGAQIPVRYTVTNLGSGATHGDSWTENIWLTRDKNRPHPGQGDILLQTLTHDGALDRFAGYETETTVRIPREIESGTWYVTPWVDPFDVIPEDTLASNTNPDDPNNVDNNNYKARAIDVLGQQPDLIVSQVIGPATAEGGDFISVTWTVENIGLADADPGGWLDRIYLSDNPDPKADGAKTLLLGEIRRDQPLAVGASYTDTFDLQLSPSAVGQYIVVITDDDVPPPPSIDLSGFFGGLLPPAEEFNPVDEIDETNNSLAVGTDVTTYPANLKVVSFDVPTDAESGEEITFSYTVENIGSNPVWSGTRYWRDFIWLSQDDVFIRDRASYLGAAVFAPSEVINPGDQYTVTFTTTLPEGTGGDYSLWVHLDAHNDKSPIILPYQARLLETDWYPADEGNNAAWLAHFDRWAWEDPSDNLARTDLPILYKEADLVVTDFQVPAGVTSGETVELTYTIENAGNRATRVNSWTDRVFISHDASLDNFDHQLGARSHGGILEPGESYTSSMTVRIPDGIEGDFHLMLFTDSAAQRDRSGRPSDIGFELVGIEFELPGSLAPWDLASEAARESARGKVKEYQLEGNNIAIRDLPVTLAPLPDLQVTAIVAPPRADRGQEITVDWTVTNLGGNTVNGQEEWLDLIYLSRDEFLDLRSDIYLGAARYEDGLEAGLGYSRSLTVSLPSDLLGPYYVFVITDPDRTNSTGDVFEGSNERNNSLTTVQPMIIELPPPSDLQVTDIVVPTDVVAGEPATITWTVTNTSSEVASGRWSDTVFFSDDATWDLRDAPAGRLEFRGTLQPGESYTQDLEVLTPSLTPGAYRAIVRTDIFNQVYEDVGDFNNITASPLTMELTAPFLTLDVPLETTLATGQQRLYAVNVPFDRTLRVTVFAEDDSTHEVFARFNDAPTVRAFDSSSGGILSENPAAIIPATEAGTYYVLVRGFATESDDSPVRILAELLPLAITDIQTDIGGDSKFVTTTISGARFHEDAIVKLVRPGFAELLPVNRNYVSASELIVTFDFEDAPHGLYDVQVINPGGEVAVVPYRFQIERTIEPEVTVGIGGPRYIFAGDTGDYSLTLQNLGNVDAPYVFYNVGVPELGVNDNVYGLKYHTFTSNLRGGPETGPYADLPFAELDAAVNTDGHVTASGYEFDKRADGFSGFSFQVQTYPGLRELHDHAFEELKAKIYAAFPQYAEQDILADGPAGLDIISPGLSLIWEVFGAVPDLLTQPLIPYQFHVVASATTMTRDEFIEHALGEADQLRQGILADDDADAALVNLAGNQAAWQSMYLAYLSESGRLRAEDAIPPTRRDQELASLMATLAGGVLDGPGGDQIVLTGEFGDFFENVRRWYGHDPELLAPTSPNEPDFTSDSLSFLGILGNPNPIPELPRFEDYDLGLTNNTHFQALRVYVPWVPFSARGAGIPADYQIVGVTPNDEDAFFPLDLQGYYDQAGDNVGAVSQTGPFTLETGGFVPANEPLPFTVNFQNDPNTTRYANEVRVVVPFDENVEPRTFQLGDIKVGDITIR
ncbi:MAG: CARDB domain-containing protein, partial [Planctomycetota bacterium]